MTEILGNFYQERLNDGVLTGNGNSLAKRFRNLVKEHVETDPRYQGKIDNYLNKSATDLLEISGGAEIDESQLRYSESIWK